MKQTLALTASIATTPVIYIGAFSRGHVHVPSGSSITTLTFYTIYDDGETPLPLEDNAAAAVAMTVQAAYSQPIRSEVFGARAVAIVANAAGTINLSLQE